MPLRLVDVKRERPLACEGEVTHRLRLQMIRLLADARGPVELERGLVVMGEHVGKIFRPLASLLLEPGSRFPVSGGEGTGRGSFFFGLGDPDGDAAKAALDSAIRAAKV